MPHRRLPAQSLHLTFRGPCTARHNLIYQRVINLDVIHSRIIPHIPVPAGAGDAIRIEINESVGVEATGDLGSLLFLP